MFFSLKPPKQVLPILLCPLVTSALAEKPNIIVIFTDDQGYAEDGAHAYRLYNLAEDIGKPPISPTSTPTK